MREPGTGGDLPQGGAISWEAFLNQRERQRHRALGLDPDQQPWLAAWRCGEHADALRPLLDAVRPDPAVLSAGLAPGALLPPPRSEGPMEAFQHRAGLEERVCSGLPDTPQAPLAWALERLAFLGDRVEDRERRAWQGPWQVDPAQDAAAAAVWAAWSTGAVWDLRAPFERLYLADARRAFQAVCAARSLPPSAVRRALDELQEGLFYRFVVATNDGLPGWTELAARTLETAAQGPTQPLAACLKPESSQLAAACVAQKGSWRSAVSQLLGGATAAERAHRVGPLLRDPEPLLDAYVVGQLLAAWSEGRTGGDWRIVTQGRGRLRARLRLLAGQAPEALLAAVLDLDALAARSRAAMRRYAWTWAWEELARDFAFDLGRPLAPPCRLEVATPPPPPVALPLLRAWVLLVVLRGRLPHLQRWVSEGSTGSRDTTWGRLLADALPAQADAYPAVRIDLAEQLEPWLVELRPTLRALAALPPGRRLRAQVEAILSPEWHPELDLPRSGFPTMLAHAAEALARWEQP